MKTAMILICLAVAGIRLKAQQARYISNPVYYEPNLSTDTVNHIAKAATELHKLKEGVLVVKLQRATESIETYRKAGLNDVADKIAYTKNLENEKIFDAFERYFSFCKVYYVYADDAKTLLENKKGALLNSGLKNDPTIQLPNSNFLFCELSKDNNAPVKTNADATVGADKTLSITDKSGRLLHGPFPATVTIENGNYAEAIKLLDKQLEVAYYNMVIDKITGENIAPKAQELEAKDYHP